MLILLSLCCLFLVFCLNSCSHKCVLLFVIAFLSSACCATAGLGQILLQIPCMYEKWVQLPQLWWSRQELWMCRWRSCKMMSFCRCSNFSCWAQMQWIYSSLTDYQPYIPVGHFCAVLLLILLLLPYPKECINQIKIYHTFHGCILLLYTLPSVNSYIGVIMTFLNHALRFSNAFHSYSQVWTDPGRQAFLTLLFIFLVSAIVYSQAYSL